MKVVGTERGGLKKDAIVGCAGSCVFGVSPILKTKSHDILAPAALILTFFFSLFLISGELLHSL